MPELPEVETVRQGLEQLVLGKTLTHIDVRVPKMVKTNLEVLQEKLIGQSIQSVTRRGKYLIFDFGKTCLISHLRMEGKYLSFLNDVAENKHFHVFFTFSDQSTLVYQDVRKFGTFDIVAKEHLFSFFTSKKLGPEPVLPDFDLLIFQKQLKKSRKSIKTILLDQILVVGLGNIYVDEVLWASGIHPERQASSLIQNETIRLHDQIIKVLAFAVSKGGSSVRTYRNALGKDGEMQYYLKVYGKTGQVCKSCQDTIQKIKVGGRGTHYCPSCQKL